MAEREIDWDEMKKSLPAGTPKPHDSILQPGSLIFNDRIKTVENMENYFQWWRWQTGANWKAPKGPGSSIENKGSYPVVHIAYEDAKAYCEWANRRLPTEAEWESAAQGNYKNAVFPWGDDVNLLNSNANTWQGDFPVKNESIDGYEMIAPVKSFPANSIGIFDMVGNVWEITDDLLSKGLAREITRRVQSKRKDLDLELEDTITLKVWLSKDSPKLNGYISNSILVASILWVNSNSGYRRSDPNCAFLVRPLICVTLTFLRL